MSKEARRQAAAGNGAPAPQARADGKRRAARAAQFMPFAALTGYYELAREQERIVEPKHELTEEEALALSRELSQAQKGDLLRVTFYDWDGYITRTGVVEQIEVPFRRLRLSGKTIAFDDIKAISRTGKR